MVLGEVPNQHDLRIDLNGLARRLRFTQPQEQATGRAALVEMQPILRAGDRYATFLDVMGRPGRTGFGPEDCSCEVPPRTRAPSRGFEENG